MTANFGGPQNTERKEITLRGKSVARYSGPLLIRPPRASRPKVAIITGNFYLATNPNSLYKSVPISRLDMYV